jgi:cell shape-determining protein MreC
MTDELKGIAEGAAEEATNSLGEFVHEFVPVVGKIWSIYRHFKLKKDLRKSQEQLKHSQEQLKHSQEQIDSLKQQVVHSQQVLGEKIFVLRVFSLLAVSATIRITLLML